MFESKYNKLLTGILIFIVIAIIGLLIFLGIQYWSSINNTQEAEDFVDNYNKDGAFVATVEENNEENNEPVEENGEDNSKIEMNTNTTNTQTTKTTTKPKKKEYNGFLVDGTMEIPKINLKYPVLSTNGTKQLDTALVFLYGAGLNHVGNSVIVGHNYKNGQFFSNLKKVSNGDKIYITDYEGVKKTYTIYHHFITSPDDTSFYQRDTNGKAEISLSTCTDDSSGRLIVLAKED